MGNGTSGLNTNKEKSSSKYGQDNYSFLGDSGLSPVNMAYVHDPDLTHGWAIGYNINDDQEKRSFEKKMRELKPDQSKYTKSK